MARQLSFFGVEFSVQEVLLDSEFIQMYDESVKTWLEVRRQFQVWLSFATIYNFRKSSTQLSTQRLMRTLSVARGPISGMLINVSSSICVLAPKSMNALQLLNEL